MESHIIADEVATLRRISGELLKNYSELLDSMNRLDNAGVMILGEPYFQPNDKAVKHLRRQGEKAQKILARMGGASDGQ